MLTGATHQNVETVGWLESDSLAIRSETACFHCGEPCGALSFSTCEKAFCCQGCRIVHDLLKENGLDQFYDITRHPGSRVKGSSQTNQWTFLDEAPVQQSLLDFTDGDRSQVTFHIPSIHCVACVWLLENLCRLHPGIGRSEVNFTRREVSISFGTRKIKMSELVELLASIGYEPSLTFNDLEKGATHSARKREWMQIGLAGFAFGNIMLFSIPDYFGMDSFSGPVFQKLFGWLSLALALPVVVFSAQDYWKAALLSIRQRIATLDVPIALGLAAIYLQSVYEVMVLGRGGYCDSLTGLIFFLLCGRAFQQKTQERLAFDRDFKSFFPLSILRVRNGQNERVSLGDLEIGDRILVRNGEIIPADSILINGPAIIDYSFITGESEPVPRAIGDYLYAGGQQAGATIEVESVKAVSQGYLTSLWNHEAFRKTRDTDLNTETNRYSRRFIQVVIGVAVVAALFWLFRGEAARGLRAFTSVLIVACPCALALAAPFTLGTAQRWLTRLNVFFKNSLTLERLARVEAIVFDKTGTLTSSGQSTVEFEGMPLASAEASWIASLARHSTHPHSTRIWESLGLKSQFRPVENYRETPGCGVEGTVDGHAICIGSRAWFESRGLHCPAPAPMPQGSAVLIGIDGVQRGTFWLLTGLRPEADRLIRQLGRSYELSLLSGDNERERETFRALFGPDARLDFNRSPLEKLNYIRHLQESGKVVMMVGDGLNDAGALRQSDVGVAVVEKIGTFSPASDVIVDARRVPQLLEILTFAKRATRIVRISFGISAAYNLAGVGFAAAGLLSPVICAVLMPVSSVSVVLFACGATTWLARRMVRDLARSTGLSTRSAEVRSGNRFDLLTARLSEETE